MKIKFTLKKFHLKETFSIAYGNYNHRNALLIELSHQKCKGYGECVAIDYYQINLKDFVLKLKEIQHTLQKQEVEAILRSQKISLCLKYDLILKKRKNKSARKSRIVKTKRKRNRFVFNILYFFIAHSEKRLDLLKALV